MSSSARDFVPPHRSLDALRQAVQTCRGCELYQRATQAVFGEGEERAHLMLVGEQPGDMEDVAEQRTRARALFRADFEIIADRYRQALAG
jgi:hypothetical protein